MALMSPRALMSPHLSAKLLRLLETADEQQIQQILSLAKARHYTTDAAIIHMIADSKCWLHYTMLPIFHEKGLI